MARLSILARRLNSPVPGLAPLILMTDTERLADPEIAVDSMPQGSVVILRHYGAEGRLALSRRLSALCRRHRLKLLIAADARLAAALGADGVHLPEAMALQGPGAWRRWRRPGWIVTAAAHSPAALFGAARAGADAALLGPVFHTASHPDARPIGVPRFTAWCRLSPIPVYALGGISTATAPRLAASGAVGFAAIGAWRPPPRRRPVRPGVATPT